ncbi:hypothetical protein BASA81_001877 [Batrachochytrium salamandrivorans]|nr:hypothetical protein BASA81_001877 [Batrachochytrium salamandrivorans]
MERILLQEFLAKHGSNGGGGAELDSLLGYIETCQTRLTNLNLVSQLELLHKQSVPPLDGEGEGRVEQACLSMKSSLSSNHDAMRQLAERFAKGDGEDDKSCLDLAVVGHLGSVGLIDTALVLARESRTTTTTIDLERIRLGQLALEQIRTGAGLDLAIAWLSADRHSSTLFEFHKAKLCALPPDLGLQYVREHLTTFAAMPQHSREVELLVIRLVMSTTSAVPAYPSSADLAGLFTVQLQRDFLHLGGVLHAGWGAAKDFTQYQKLVQSQWNQSELPAFLTTNCQVRAYHTEFQCPVSGEAASEGEGESDGNPPMLLACGHVFLWRSLQRMESGRRSPIFKCPTCPKELTLGDATRIHF